MHKGIIAKSDASGRSHIEHRTQIAGRAASILYRRRQGAAKEVEAEGRFHVGCVVERDVLGNRARVPIPLEFSVCGHDTSPMTSAGLPMTRARDGTLRLTTAPGSTKAPAPMRTPLRMVAFGPIQTSSSIITSCLTTMGRGLPLPRGEQAMASATRWAGAIGWKSVSATVAFQPMTT